MGPVGGNHEPEAAALSRGSVGWKPEARPQHRMRMNPRKGCSVWASTLLSVTPDIQRRRSRSGGGGGGTSCTLTLGDLPGSARGGHAVHSGRTEEGNDDRPMLREKSDHLIVAMKPGNAGGAKGVMG